MTVLDLPQLSREALLNGASMFIELVPNYILNEKITKALAPYQVGDEVYFYDYKATIKDVKVVRVQELSFKEKLLLMCRNTINVRKPEIPIIKNDFKKWYNEQYKNYEDNPYVFLYAVERIK